MRGQDDVVVVWEMVSKQEYYWGGVSDVESYCKEDDSDNDLNKFLELTTTGEMKDCFRQFRAATSNESLRMYRCVVCARELGGEDGEMSRLIDDPRIRELLQPIQHHPAHALWQGALVLGEEIQVVEDGHAAWICTECGTALRKDKLPRHSLANSLWIGDIPWELAGLTIPEQLLIARHYPRCYVFKLYPRGGGNCSQINCRGA